MSPRLKRLSDQVIVITGASSGIGLVTARRAAKAGATVILVARNEPALREASEAIDAAGGRAHYVVADVGLEDDVDRVVAFAQSRCGGFDTWVNNAGVGLYAPLVATPTREHERLFRTNYWGVVFGSLAAADVLRARGGALVTVGSIAADMGSPMLGAYSASKHAVKGFIDALRIELLAERAPISVTLIKPSGIDTPLAQHAANHLEGEARIPPPVYSPELVADAILNAAQHPRRELTVGGAGFAQTLLAAHAPSLFDRLGSLTIPMMMDRRRPRTTTDNLDRPQRDGSERSGIQPGRPFSVFTAAELHPAWAIAASALAVAAVVAITSKARPRTRKDARKPRIVITGVSSGIGRASAAYAIARGAHIYGSVRNAEDAARLTEAFGADLTPLVLDLRDEAAVLAAADRVRDELGGATLSGLVNNAGVAIPGPVLLQPLAEIREQIETDLVGQIVATRAFAPLLGTDGSLRGPPGRIVMMSSIAGEVGQPFLSGYVASKHGVEGFADTLRRELQLFGIDVVTIGPALVDTPIWDKAEPYLGRYAGTPYAASFDRGVRAMVTMGHAQSLSADAVARLVWTALTAARPRARYAPARHPVVEQALSRALPKRWLDSLVGGVLGLGPADRGRTGST